MHRSSIRNPVGHCSSTDQHQYPANTTYSLLFSSPMPNPTKNHQHSDYYSYPTITSPSSSVDCTLSLGIPSSSTPRHQRNSSSSSSPSCVSKLCSWNNIFQSNKQKNPPSAAATRTGGGGGNAATENALTSRRCANCDTTSTPLWRNGPRGPKSLCNACGIRYKKEERRATGTSGSSGAQQEQLTWTAQHAQSMPPSCPVTEFRFIEGDDGHSYMNTSTGGATNIPFLPWRLNVPDRHSSLVHDYI